MDDRAEANPADARRYIAMSRRTRNLPALSALITFECAARHQSFKDAARELGVTPGAISHQIKLLEGELDQPLFTRQHRGVILTKAGSLLFATLDSLFDELGATLQQIRTGTDETSVTIGATSAVSTLLLRPAIGRFWRENSHIAINQLVSDRRFTQRDAPELYIRYGRDTRSDVEQHALYRDALVPVCAPSLADRLATPGLAELAEQRLIHLIAEDANWTTWQRWFEALGYQGGIASGIQVNNYSIALAAAEDEAGVALGWRRLVQPLLDSGALCVLSDFALDAPNRFYLVTLPADQLSANAIRLRDGLLEQLGQPGSVE